MNRRKWAVQFLQGFSILLLALILFAFLTGGGVLRLGRMKLELSALDPWVVALILLVALIRFAFNEKSWVLEKAKLAFSRLEDEPKAAIGLLFWVGVLGFFGHVARHLSFSVDTFDVSFVHPPLFNAFSNPFLKCDVCLGGALPGEHLAFSFLFLAPIVNLLKDTLFHDYWIFFLQAVFLISGVLFLSTRGRLKDRKDLWFTAIAILVSHRAFRNAFVWDFREDVIAFFGFSLALFSLYQGRLVLYFCSIVLAALSKENMALVLPFLAVPILFSEDLSLSKRKRVGIAFATLSFSLAYAYLSFKVWMPLFNPYGSGAHTISSRFGAFGSTPADILKNVLFSPTAWWQLISEKLLLLKVWKYLFLLLGPVLFIAYRKPWWLVPALPGIAMNVFSSNQNQWTLQFHYDLLILPFLFFAFVMALSNVTVKERQIALLIALALSGRWPMRAITQYWPSLNEVKDSLYLAQVNSTGLLAADSRLMPQVSQMNGLRILSTPKSKVPTDAQDVWPEFLKIQTEDLTRLPERKYLLADRFLFDLENPWHQKLAQVAEAQPGFWVEPKSPSGRYQIVNRIVPR